MANSEQPHIALVDDDPKIRELTAKYLSDQQLSIKTAANGSELDELMKNNNISLIILDLMMPEESGLNICQRLRVNNVEIPIIMLTAKGDEVDRIVGLEMGADDYLPKPFNPRELLARVNAILRRQQQSSIQNTKDIFEFGNFSFDISNRSLHKNCLLYTSDAADDTPCVDPLLMVDKGTDCLLYTSPSPRDGLLSRMPSSA